MKYSIVAAALVAVAGAQTLADVPSCALPCLDSAITSTTKCTTTDIACICQADNFKAVQGAATSCVIDKCGADVALSQVLPATQKLCEAVPAAGSSPAAATTSASETSSSAAPETSSSAAAVTTSSTVMTTAAPITTTSSNATITTTKANSSAPHSTTTTAAVPNGAAAIGSFGAAAMLAVAAFAL